MTGKIKSYYLGLNKKTKALLVLLNMLIFLFGMALFAKAIGGPTITITPTGGSTVSQVRPQITAGLSTDIDNTRTVFKLNGSQIQPTYNNATFTLSYIPNNDLPDGNYTVDVTVYDASGNSSNANATFAIKTSRPQLDGFSPLQVTSNKNPIVSLNVTDPDQIDGNSLQMSIDGVNVSATLSFKDQGYWANGYDGWYWVSTGTDYTKATVNYQTNNLTLATHQVQIKIADKLGNTMNYSWSFDVALPPSISAANPADGTNINNNQPTVSAKISVSPDSGAIDTVSSKVLIDNLPVNPSYDSTTGSITAPAAATLADGKHTWEIDAKSTKGLTTTYKASFNVDTKPPALTVYPTTGTVIKTNTATRVGFDFSDTGGIDEQSIEIKIDGNTVPTTIHYNEVWVYPAYQDPYLSGYDYTKGSIYYNVPALLNGVHTATFKINDKAGNQTLQSTSFTYAIPFSIGNCQPADKSNIVNSTPAVSFGVSNAGQADWNSLAMTLDGSAVTPQIDKTQGVVSFQPVTPLVEGTHKVSVSLSDITGQKASNNWSFAYYAPGERLTLNPADGAVVSTLPANQDSDKIKITFNDPNSPIDENSIFLKINGQQVPFTVVYNELWDTNPYTGDPYFQGYDYNNGKIISKSNFPDGIYAASLEVKDKAGYVKDKSWNFNIAVAPQVTNLTPADKGIINTVKPHINAQFTDPNGPAIDSASIRLYIDNVQVNATFTPASQTSGAVDYDANFNSEGNHTAKLVVADSQGDVSTTNWSFYINSYGDMAITPQSCSACHSIDQYGKHVHTKGPDLETTGGTATHGQTGTCGHCHTAPNTAPITDPNFCAYCHGDPNPMSAGPAPNGSYSTQSNKNCLDCHSKKDTWTGASSFPLVTGYPNEPQPTYPVVHNIFGLHNTSNTSCTVCHNGNLTREHNIRKDANGQAFTCNTCHSSTRTDVQNAISTKNTDCMACHSQTNSHETVHTDSLDNNCQTCHKSTLSAEHLSNTKTQSKTLNCGTCHQSQRQDIQAAIISKNLNCSSCHDAAHGLPLQKVIPADIPLYTQVKWSSPIAASIWAGESWMPDEFAANGQVLISNRSTALTGDAVWSYYNQQLTAQGWQLSGSPPAVGSNYYQATFTKTDTITNTLRKLMVNFYGGENHTAGPVVSTGYRIEIIIK